MHKLIAEFAFEHLLGNERLVAMQFSDFAASLDDVLPDGSNTDMALSYLLRARDRAVSALMRVDS